MAAGDEFKNPPILKSEPADGDVMQYEAATDTWKPVTLGSLPAADIPQTHIGQAGAISAEVADAVATTASTNVAPFGYSQAQADDIVAELNQAISDLGTLITEVTALRAGYNTLLTELQTAGILASS